MTTNAKLPALLKNPFYLISAMLMLIASIPINFTQSIDDMTQLIKDLVVYEFVVYELCLFAGFYALWTLFKNKIDGQLLLTLCVLFAFDPTFTYFKHCIDGYASVPITLVLLVIQAALKLYLCSFAIRKQVDPMFVVLLSLVYLSFVAVAYLPALVFTVNDTEWHGHIFWVWAVLSLPLILLVQQTEINEFWDAMEQKKTMLLYRCRKAAQPIIGILLLAHVCSVHFVYSIEFYVSALQIPFIIYVWRLLCIKQSRPMHITLLIGINLLIVLLTMCAEQQTLLRMGDDGEIRLTAFRLSCGLLALLHVHVAWRLRWYPLFVVSAGYGICASAASWGALGQTLQDYMPDSAIAWGAVGIAVAFICAGLGFYLSTRNSISHLDLEV